ncbi:MAG: transcription elongation factor GreA [Nitrospinota bacterium]|nr:transcription elongation factor GreA [Nitrospinota bacterium]
MSAKVPMTKEGYERLRDELQKLKKVERPKIIKEISVARAHGDLSENAEYHAAKEKQSFIEGRIGTVEDKLARAQVIDTATIPKDRVVFGVVVHLEDMENGGEIKYQIVGDDEANVDHGKISISSPIARALIGKVIDDEVTVITPAGKREYAILDIE